MINFQGRIFLILERAFGKTGKINRIIIHREFLILSIILKILEDIKDQSYNNSLSVIIFMFCMA